MKSNIGLALTLIAAVLAGGLLVTGVMSPQTKLGAAPEVVNPNPVAQCVEPCSVNGATGECVMNVCVRSSGCTRDVDCDDGNSCTVEWCGEDGVCGGGSRDGECTLPDAMEGACRSGLCEPRDGHPCAVDSECAGATSECLERACVDGICTTGSRTGVVECSSSTGRSGRCADGNCLADLANDARKCVMRWNSYLGWMPDCRSGLKFHLEAEEVARTESDLEKRMASNLRYDLKVALVELVGGGYNIVLHNRRPRTEVRGLCDPSFVAFEMAGFTAGTNWKSQNLHVWLRPYEEGWATPTRGSRIAVEQGRANSALGALGVVDVKAFRTWLEKAFTPLDPNSPKAGRDSVAATAPLAPLPPRVDAGVSVDAGSNALASAADAGAGVMSGRQALQKAWEAFGAGRKAEAVRLNRYARNAGVRDPDLDELLQ